MIHYLLSVRVVRVTPLSHKTDQNLKSSSLSLGLTLVFTLNSCFLAVYVVWAHLNCNELMYTNI